MMHYPYASPKEIQRIRMVLNNGKDGINN